MMKLNHTIFFLFQFPLNDSHTQLVIHWAGENSDVIIALAKGMSEIMFILTHYHTMPHFDALKIIIQLENIVRKGEIAWNKCFTNVFYPIWHFFFFILHFKNVVCNLFEFGQV